MAKANTKPELWERQPGETPKAFEAFCIYRDMGPGRSHPKVSGELGKSVTLISRWAFENNWTDRCAAWDAEQDRLVRMAQAGEILKMRMRHADLACEALDMVKQALESRSPEDLSNTDIARFMDVASKLERLSRGDTSEVVEERDGGQALNPVQIYVPDNGRTQKDTYDDLEV